MLKYAPNGRHHAFEPIPYLFDNLKNRYGNKVKVHPFALADDKGETSFYLVKNAPAYSGIKIRNYRIRNPEIEQITVAKERLDDVVFGNQKIDFIKIDVEGGEFAVLKGSIRLLQKYKPVILFEFGKGASDHYGTTPDDIYDFLSEDFTYKIYTLDGFLSKDEPIKKADLVNYFEKGTAYYFLAV